MKRKSLFVLLLLSLASGACGSGSTTPESGGGTAGGETVDAALVGRMPPAATDLQPVAMPSEVVATVRFGALESTFGLVGRAFGAAEQSASALADARRHETGSDALSALVDTSGGMDIVWIHREDDSPAEVYGFDGPSMRSVVTSLPRTLEVEPQTDGSLFVPATAGEGGPTRTCSIEPSGRGDRTRIVCSGSAQALDVARRYLGRSMRGTVDPGLVRANVELDALRARFGEQARAGLAVAPSLLDATLSEAESPLLRNERVRAAIAAIVRDVVDDVSPLVGELSAVELSARFDDAGMTVDFDVAVAQPSGSLVRGLAEALRNEGTIPSDLLDRLPPGAVAYVSGHFDSRPFDALMTEVRDLLAAFAHAGIQLGQADADALDRGLAFALRTSAYEAAAAAGMDEAAQPWSVTHVRYASAADATQAVTAHRELVAALRRPGIARAFDALLEDLGEDRPRFTQIAEIRTRGLPAGSYAVRMPPFGQLITAYMTRNMGITAPAQPLSAPLETFVVPNGADVLVVQGAHGRALYDSLTNAGGIAAEIRSELLTPGAAATVAMRLGNVRVPGQVADHETGAPTLESQLGAEAGQAIITFRLRNTASAPDARFEIDLHLPSAILRAITAAGRAAAQSTIPVGAQGDAD